MRICPFCSRVNYRFAERCIRCGARLMLLDRFRTWRRLRRAVAAVTGASRPGDVPEDDTPVLGEVEEVVGAPAREAPPVMAAARLDAAVAESPPGVTIAAAEPGPERAPSRHVEAVPEAEMPVELPAVPAREAASPIA